MRKYSRKRKSSIRKAYKIKKEAPLLLYAGRIAEEKNLKFLIRSIDEIRKKAPEAVFVLAGKEERTYKHELDKLITSRGLENNIIFTGNLPERKLIELYHEAKLFIFPSRSETQGIVILEAMASGTPVIAVEGPSVDDFIDDGKNGFIMPEDAKMFADKTIDVLDDEETIKRLSRNAKKKASRFSSEAMVGKIIDEFKQLKPSGGHYKRLRNIKEIINMDWESIIRKA